VPLYCGAPARYFGDTTGGPVYYRLEPIRGRIEVQVTGHAGAVEATVVGTRADGTCAREVVLGSEVEVVRDETMYVIVDGPASGYTLTLDCTPDGARPRPREARSGKR
jgi:hypothetical protein